MKNKTRSALLVIDIEQGFLSKESAYCIRGAAATVPACERAVKIARNKWIPVFFVKRIYRPDGSDVESTRYQAWNIRHPGTRAFEA